MNNYDLPATSSLVTDDGKPDFIVNSTIGDWWEQVDKSDFYTAFVLGILVGIMLGIILYKFLKWFNRKYDEHIPDYKENNDSDSEE